MHMRTLIILHFACPHSRNTSDPILQVVAALDESGKYTHESLSKDRHTRLKESIMELRLQSLDQASALEKQLR